jgi:hypothetical protein
MGKICMESHQLFGSHVIPGHPSRLQDGKLGFDYDVAYDTITVLECFLVFEIFLKPTQANPTSLNQMGCKTRSKPISHLQFSSGDAVQHENSNKNIYNIAAKHFLR